MNKPTAGQLVEVVTEFGLRQAIVDKPWEGDVGEVARKLGISEAEVEALHGMRATVSVFAQVDDPIPHSPYVVTNMEYDENGQRLGTWHYYPQDL